MRSSPINLTAIRCDLKQTLVEKGETDPDNTSLVIISRALGRPKSWILAHSEYQLTLDEKQSLQNLVAKYARGIPLPYILGTWEFYGRNFKVTPTVLIPRPETELIVDLALSYGKEKETLLIVDVGTGSGAIAVSLSANFQQSTVVAIDISRKALTIAKENAIAHNQKRIKFLQADLLAPLKTKFNLICANLPYIPSRKLSSLAVAKWEPKLALDGGQSGLDHIERLLQQTVHRLKPEGCILLEIESSLGGETLTVARRIFPNATLNLYQDHAGLDRVVEIIHE